MDVKLRNVTGGSKFCKIPHVARYKHGSSQSPASVTVEKKPFFSRMNLQMLFYSSVSEGNATGTPRYSAELFGGVVGLILRDYPLCICVLRKMGKKGVFNLHVCKLCLCIRTVNREQIYRKSSIFRSLYCLFPNHAQGELY